jgi:hypothetical protein
MILGGFHLHAKPIYLGELGYQTEKEELLFNFQRNFAEKLAAI